MTILVPSAGNLAEHATAIREAKPLTLPAGRTEEEAVRVAIQHRKQIWGAGYRDEDQRLAELQRRCTILCLNDRDSGVRLTQRAIWGQ